jgi:hypothetical protein
MSTEPFDERSHAHSHPHHPHMQRGLLGRVPGARGILFDRPEIIEAAKSAIATSGFADRARRI